MAASLVVTPVVSLLTRSVPANAAEAMEKAS
jgi:hypothetical protein